MAAAFLSFQNDVGCTRNPAAYIIAAARNAAAYIAEECGRGSAPALCIKLYKRKNAGLDSLQHRSFRVEDISRYRCQTSTPPQMINYTLPQSGVRFGVGNLRDSFMHLAAQLLRQEFHPCGDSQKV